MKQFDLPSHYRSSFIGQVKARRRLSDPRKKDLTPSVLDFGPVRFILPRHFGFCYGVENAIEISYRALKENPDKRILLLSEMIHNPAVNEDLLRNGIRFIMDTEGNHYLPWEEVTDADVVIIPAFGTTIEIMTMLTEKGVNLQRYDTTCPFVEKVWKRSSEIGHKGFTVLIHGKSRHEETRATFSHSYQHAPAVILRDMAEARVVAGMMRGTVAAAEFAEVFRGRTSAGFDPLIHLERVGVVNQTTMLASETQEIADFFREVMTELHGAGYRDYFADTRDTLCYATNDNQEAAMALRDCGADLALVIGGYNSSNTSQLVTILGQTMPTYFIKDQTEIGGPDTLQHYDYSRQQMRSATDWLPAGKTVTVALGSGASCPDSVIDNVIMKIRSYFPESASPEEVLAGMP